VEKTSKASAARKGAWRGKDLDHVLNQLLDCMIYRISFDIERAKAKRMSAKESYYVLESGMHSSNEMRKKHRVLR